MRIRSAHWEKYAASLHQELVGQRLSKITHFDGAVFVSSLSKSGSLVFVLSGDQPRVYASSFPASMSSLNSTLSTAMRKNLSNARIESIKTLNGDSILEIALLGTNDIFQPVPFYLIAELIPYKGNLILLDQERKVVASLYSGSLDSVRPLFRGLAYQFPEKPADPPSSGEFLPFETIHETWISKEAEILEKRKKSLYSSLFTKAKKNVKTLENRLKAIDSDIVSAKAHLQDYLYGDYIFTCLDEIDPSLGHFDYYGEEVKLDPLLSAKANAEVFYKRYKKSKLAIEKARDREKAALGELEEAKAFLHLLDLSSEEDLKKIEKEIGPLEGKGSSAHYGNSTSFFPFECFIGETRYVYGRNARQNDFLGTLFSKKGENPWLHVKLGHGAHLIIDKPNPTDKEIEHGCEICLLASNVSAGEVMIAKKKDVKKGNTIGQAIVKQYTSATIKRISKEAKEAFESGRKVIL